MLCESLHTVLSKPGEGKLFKLSFTFDLTFRVTVEGLESFKSSHSASSEASQSKTALLIDCSSIKSNPRLTSTSQSEQRGRTRDSMRLSKWIRDSSSSSFAAVFFRRSCLALVSLPPMQPCCRAPLLGRLEEPADGRQAKEGSTAPSGNIYKDVSSSYNGIRLLTQCTSLDRCDLRACKTSRVDRAIALAPKES